MRRTTGCSRAALLWCTMAAQVPPLALRQHARTKNMYHSLAGRAAQHILQHRKALDCKSDDLLLLNTCALST